MNRSKKAWPTRLILLTWGRYPARRCTWWAGLVTALVMLPFSWPVLLINRGRKTFTIPEGAPATVKGDLILIHGREYEVQHVVDHTTLRLRPARARLFRWLACVWNRACPRVMYEEED